ncbi:hypothetical protein ACFC1R_13200 [Kitasatospora sp. NPDC056138]|uniref:hypothetical protein n=1 Tax=Kitasatospora sp. NPDC056138 TaxID=3345724 RepID=UPI0035DE61EC
MEEHGEQRRRVPFGPPREIVLLATPGGWRHSVTTTDGALVCGRVPQVAVDADAEQAKDAAAAMIMGLGHEFHGIVLEVSWEPGRSAGSWNGRVRQGPGPCPTEPGPPDAGT